MRRDSTNNEMKEARIFGKDITNQVNCGGKHHYRINNQILIKVSDKTKKENSPRPEMKLNRVKNHSMDENLLTKINPLGKNIKQKESTNIILQNIKNFPTKSNNNIPSENFTQLKNDNEDVYMKTVSDDEEQGKKTLQVPKLKANNHNFLPHILSDKIPPHEDLLLEIYQNLIEEELLFWTALKFKQEEINERMRTILINWIYEVIHKFKLRQATLFLTISILDKYLNIKEVSKVLLQLVGVSSLLIACKYEEIYYPEIRDLVYITDHTYTQKQIIQMEYEILSSLNFFILPIFPLRFVEILSKEFFLTEIEFNFCCLILTIFNFNTKVNEYPPSVIACSCIYIIWKIKNDFTEDKKEKISPFFNKNLPYDIVEFKVKDCAKMICYLLDNIDLPIFSFVREKFDLRQFTHLKVFFNPKIR
jgi:hypothetical protein